MAIHRVTSGQPLQPVIDSCAGGDKIVVDNGGVYQGPFILPPKERNVTISGFGRYHVEHSTPIFRTGPGARNWTIEDAILPSNRNNTDLIRLGEFSQTLTEMPDNIHLFNIKSEVGEVNTRRGLTLNSKRTSVRYCDFTNIKERGQETQAILGANGSGPYLIEYCKLSAGAIGFMLGGSRPSIPNLVPSNLIFRHNEINIPEDWMYDGEAWVRKNLFELKNCDTALIEHNVFKHNWRQAQDGYAIVFTPRSGSTPETNPPATWTRVSNITFRHNRIEGSSCGINMLGRDTNTISDILSNVKVYDNDFVLSKYHYGGLGRFLQLVNMQFSQNVQVYENRVINDGDAIFVDSSVVGQQIPVSNSFEFTDNVVTYGRIWGNRTTNITNTVPVYFPYGQIGANTLGPTGFIYPEKSLDRI